MTPLAGLIARQIAATGPITVAEYMTLCLLHPEHGYYTTRDPLGAAGDFTTAPEISQMFGEVLGLWLAQVWIDQGRPAPFALAELGPGRGTLMADILRATAKVPGFRDAARPHLVEVSPKLRARQRATLAGIEATWVERADDLPEMPLFLIANEVFDTLPVRQFLRDGETWRERQVGLVEGRLAFGLAAPAPLAALRPRLADTEDGDMIEMRPAADPVMAALAARIADQGGAALIVDYGDWAPRGDTFQAVRRHRPDDPLAHPGQADLTAHVDFAALARAAAPLFAAPLTEQGAFLNRLGLAQRAEVLAQALSGPARVAHLRAYRRLTHAEEMGSLFKVLALTSPTAPPLPGLDLAPTPDPAP